MPRDIYTDQSDESDARRDKRMALLEATEHLLEEEGPGALSLRRIAEACDGSTQMIYTLFGGKSDLLGALYLHGYEALADELDEVPEEMAPPERLGELGRAYRRFAIEHPALYQLMTSRPVTEFEPPPAARDRETRSFEILEECVQRCIECGHYRPEVDLREAADVHWTAVHGAVGLEIAGFYDDPETAEARFERALTAVAASFRAQ